jgi:hypothetical protein
MQEFLWYVLSERVTRPVSDHDVPLWLAVVLVFGLCCGGALIASGLTQWYRALHPR